MNNYNFEQQIVNLRDSMVLILTVQKHLKILAIMQKPIK